MFNGHKPILRGSVRSASLSHALTFHTNCCQSQFSVSQILRLEKGRAHTLGCCVELADGTARGTSVTTTGSAFSSRQRRNGSANLALNVLARHRGRDQKRHGFHTASRSLFRRGESSNAPLPSLPKKPKSSTPSNLPRPPAKGPLTPVNLPRPPTIDSSRRPTSAASPDLPLPSNPLQEFELEKERLRKENEEKRREEEKRLQRERARNETLRRQHEQQQLELAQHRAREDAIRKEKLALLGKLKEARHAAWEKTIRTTWRALERTTIRGITDKASIERQLFLDRITNVQRNMQDLAKDGGVADKLRDIGNVMFYGMKDSLDELSSRLKSRMEMLSKGDLARHHATRRLRFRMYQILWIQHRVLQGASWIAKEMHFLRDLRRAALRISRSPEVSRSSKSSYALSYLTLQVKSMSDSISTDYSHLHAMMVFASLNRFIRLSWNSKVGTSGPRYTVAHQRRLSMSSVQLVRTDLEDLTPSEIQREVLMEFRPFFSYHREYRKLITQVESLIWDVQEWMDSLSREKSENTIKKNRLYSLKRRIEDTRGQMTDVRRDLWQLGDEATLWRASTKYLFGSTRHRASRTTNDVSGPHSLPHSRPKPLPVRSHLPATWLRPSNLYPLGTAIPIHYVTTFLGIFPVLSRFSSCKILAFDTVKAVPATSGSFPLDYLMLASDREVAIFNLGVMDPVKLLVANPFADILESASILKVAVNVDSQRRILETHLGLNMEAVKYLNDCHKYDLSQIDDASDDLTFGMISSMTAQRFGSGLPALDLASASKHGGVENPRQFFSHLASRAYALLQLYQLNPVSPNPPTPHSPNSLSSSPNIGLGPVLIYRQATLLPNALPFIKKCPPLARSRILYLDELAFAMARDTYQNNERFEQLRKMSRNRRRISGLDLPKLMSYLKAYYLWTTFNESFVDISNHLKIPSLAGAILEIARFADMPLRDSDGNFLDQARRREQVGHHEWLRDLARSHTMESKESSVPEARNRPESSSMAANTGKKTAPLQVPTPAVQTEERTQHILSAKSLPNRRGKKRHSPKASSEEQAGLRHADLSAKMLAKDSRNDKKRASLAESNPVSRSKNGPVEPQVRYLLPKGTTTIKKTSAPPQRPPQPKPPQRPSRRGKSRARAGDRTLPGKPVATASPGVTQSRASARSSRNARGLKKT